jgi:hypothetical protein
LDRRAGRRIGGAHGGVAAQGPPPPRVDASSGALTLAGRGSAVDSQRHARRRAEAGLRRAVRLEADGFVEGDGLRVGDDVDARRAALARQRFRILDEQAPDPAASSSSATRTCPAAICSAGSSIASG